MMSDSTLPSSNNAPDRRALWVIQTIGQLDALIGAAFIVWIVSILYELVAPVLMGDWTPPEWRGWELIGMVVLFILMGAIVSLFLLLAVKAVVWGLAIVMRQTPETIRGVWGVTITMLTVVALGFDVRLDGSGSEETPPGWEHALEFLVLAGLLMTALLAYGIGANWFIRRICPGAAETERRIEPVPRGLWSLACFLLFFGVLGLWAEMARAAVDSAPAGPGGAAWALLGLLGFLGVPIGTVVVYKLGKRWLCERPEDGPPVQKEAARG